MLNIVFIAKHRFWKESQLTAFVIRHIDPAAAQIQEFSEIPNPHTQGRGFMRSSSAYFSNFLDPSLSFRDWRKRWVVGNNVVKYTQGYRFHE